jgi:hypothetical protein
MSQKTEQSAYSKLSPKRQRFVDEYCADFNGTQAAIRAGYSARTANEQAAALLAIPSVKEAVEERKKSLRKKSLNYRGWLLRKTRLIINKCTSADMWDPKGANGAVRNMVDILGLRLEKKEITGRDGGAIEVKSEHDLSKLSKEELRQLLALVEKAGDK